MIYKEKDLKEKHLYIGIDPSINSTGLCIRLVDNDKVGFEKFIIIRPKQYNTPKRITNKRKELLDKIDKLCDTGIFEYVDYDSEDIKQYKNDNHLYELTKSKNLVNLVDCIYETIMKYDNDTYNIHILIEGISYGSSIRTKSVFDLAGLNFMIRYKFIKYLNTEDSFTIATPSNIKKFVTNKGNANKLLIIEAFSMIHPELTILPKFDDIADAYFMSCYAESLEITRAGK